MTEVTKLRPYFFRKHFLIFNLSRQTLYSTFYRPYLYHCIYKHSDLRTFTTPEVSTTFLGSLELLKAISVAYYSFPVGN